MKLLTLFSGFGGVEFGARSLRVEPAGAVEYDAALAEVYRKNHGDHVLVADVSAVDYRQWAGVDILHASPVCTRASVANSARGEADLDIAAAQATARAIRETRPKLFTLENVVGYREFEAFRIIMAELDALGYGYCVESVQSADYGVPQTRRRLIVRAWRDCWFSPPAMTPTHDEKGRNGRQKWCGWYDAVADLLPGCPEAALAKWQVARLGGGVVDVLVNRNSKELQSLSRCMGDPAFCVTTQQAGGFRAVVDTRTVRLTPLCLVRFQTFPDDLVLPASATLACKGIGNAVPPRLYAAVLRSLGVGK